MHRFRGMRLWNRSLRSRVLRNRLVKSARRNRVGAGLSASLGMSLLGIVVAAVGSPRIRQRARILGGELKRRAYIRPEATLVR